jgi:hypothetical protein
MGHQEAMAPSFSSARVGFGASQTCHLKPQGGAILPALQLETGPGVVAGAPAADRGGEHQDGEVAVFQVLLVEQVGVGGDQQLVALMFCLPNQIAMGNRAGRPQKARSE